MKIAIASGKGGTGKTTLSTNLATYLAVNNEVVLADLDVEEPNSGLFIKGQPIHKEDKFTMVPEWKSECSLCGLCQEVCNFHAVLQLGTQIMVFPELCHQLLCLFGVMSRFRPAHGSSKDGRVKTFSKQQIIFCGKPAGYRAGTGSTLNFTDEQVY